MSQAATPASVRKQIASGHPDAIYLLQGEDDIEKSAVASSFGALVDEGLHAFNIERIHAGDMTTGDRLASGIGSVISAARTLPMMSPWRVVIVQQADAMLAPRRESDAAVRALEAFEAYVQNPERQTVLVLVGAALDRRGRIFKLLSKHATLVDCGVLTNNADAEQWIRARVAAAGVSIEPPAARLLASLGGTDVRRLRGDVERLLVYALGQKTITAADVKEIAGPAALQDDWAMTNAIESGRAGEALAQLALMLDAGAPAEKVLGQLGWMVRTKFPAIAPARLAGAVEAVFRTDLDLKRSAGDPRILLERLVVELADRPAGARRA